VRDGPALVRVHAAPPTGSRELLTGQAGSAKIALRVSLDGAFQTLHKGVEYIHASLIISSTSSSWCEIDKLSIKI
jgi:hypothetical protein